MAAVEKFERLPEARRSHFVRVGFARVDYLRDGPLAEKLGMTEPESRLAFWRVRWQQVKTKVWVYFHRRRVRGAYAVGGIYAGDARLGVVNSEVGLDARSAKMSRRLRKG